MPIKDYIIIGAIVSLAAVFGWQKYEITHLETNVSTLTSTVNNQKNQITDLNTSVQGIVANDNNRTDNRTARDTSDAAVRNYVSKNKDKAAQNSGIIEEQINDAFDSYAKSLQELTQ